jgi:hypothetical protein
MGQESKGAETSDVEVKAENDVEMDATAQAALVLTQLSSSASVNESIVWFVRPPENRGVSSAAASVM